MEIVFHDADLEYMYVNGKEKGKPKFSAEVLRGFIKKTDMMAAATNTAELAKIRSLHFEALKGDYKGYYSVRVNVQCRIVFKINKEESDVQIEGIEVHELTDYH